MQALKETTGGDFHPHIYLLDGNNLVAYIKAGTTEPIYFSKPIKGFSQSYRKFEKADVALFEKTLNWRELLKEHVENAAPVAWIKKVPGSKPGVEYTVNTDENTCTCPGFTFRGSCKHIKLLEPA